jgi:hypothetical protein
MSSKKMFYIELFSNIMTGKFPTAKKVTSALREKIVYKGSVSSTIKLLKHLGFQYKINHDGLKFLIK